MLSAGYDLYSLGAPVRFYFLHQLPKLSQQRLARVKLAIFSAVLSVTPAEAEAIRSRLYNNNRTIVWTGASGLLSNASAADWNISNVPEVAWGASSDEPQLVGHTHPWAPVLTRLVQPADSGLTRGQRNGGGPPKWTDDLLSATAVVGSFDYFSQETNFSTGNNTSSSPFGKCASFSRLLTVSRLRSVVPLRQQRHRRWQLRGPRALHRRRRE